MQWVTGVVNGMLFGGGDDAIHKQEHLPASKPASRKRNSADTREVVLARNPSLEGRDTPIDLLDKASKRMSYLGGKAVYNPHPERELLCVTLPKTRKRKKTYEMTLYRDLETLCEAIKEEMEYDHFDSMDMMRLAAEYPNFFWNGMFHALEQPHVLSNAMERAGIVADTRRQRRRKNAN